MTVVRVEKRPQRPQTKPGRMNSSSLSSLFLSRFLSHKPCGELGSIAEEVKDVINEMRHFCKNCTSSFSTGTGLKFHIESVHEGIKYYCTECEFICTFKHNLRRHVNALHRKLRIKCEYCEQLLHDQGHRKKHMDSVHKGIRYPCPYCEFKATRKDTLSKHVLICKRK